MKKSKRPVFKLNTSELPKNYKQPIKPKKRLGRGPRRIVRSRRRNEFIPEGADWCEINGAKLRQDIFFGEKRGRKFIPDGPLNFFVPSVPEGAGTELLEAPYGDGGDGGSCGCACEGCVCDAGEGCACTGPGTDTGGDFGTGAQDGQQGQQSGQQGQEGDPAGPTTAADPYGDFAGPNAGGPIGADPYGDFAGPNAGGPIGADPYGDFAGPNAGGPIGADPYGDFAGPNAGPSFADPYGDFAGPNTGPSFSFGPDFYTQDDFAQRGMDMEFNPFGPNPQTDFRGMDMEFNPFTNAPNLNNMQDYQSRADQQNNPNNQINSFPTDMQMAGGLLTGAVPGALFAAGKFGLDSLANANRGDINNVLSDMWGGLGKGFENLTNANRGDINNVLSDMWGGMKGGLENLGNISRGDINNVLSDMWGGMKGGLENLGNASRGDLTDILSNIGGKGLDSLANSNAGTILSGATAGLNALDPAAPVAEPSPTQTQTIDVELPTVNVEPETPTAEQGGQQGQQGPGGGAPGPGGGAPGGGAPGGGAPGGGAPGGGAPGGGAPGTPGQEGGAPGGAPGGVPGGMPGGVPGMPEGAPGGLSPDPNAPPGLPLFGPDQPGQTAEGKGTQSLFDFLKSIADAKAAEPAKGGQPQGQQGNPTSYAPGTKSGDKGMEGGPGTAAKGPDGKATARTVEDYVNSGRVGHVTIAAVDGKDADGKTIGEKYGFFKSENGKVVNIESITYTGRDGKQHTEYNVPGVVHDKGPGVKDTPQHYDVATISGKGLTDKQAGTLTGKTQIGVISDTGKTVAEATKGAQDRAKAGIEEATKDAEKVAKEPVVIGRGEPSLAYTKAFNEAVNSGKGVEEAHKEGVAAAQDVESKGKGQAKADLPPGATQFPGSENFKGNDATKNAEDYKGIIIHQTGKQTIEEQGKYQNTFDKGRGGYFGYHYVIDRDGKIHAFGNPDTGRTNHMSGKTDRTDRLDLNNKNTIGIGFIGRDRTAEQTAAGKGLIDFLQGKYGIPKSEIFGHGELQTDKERAVMGPGGTPEGSKEAAGFRGAPTDVAERPGVPMPPSRPSDAPFDPGIIPGKPGTPSAPKGPIELTPEPGDRGPDPTTTEETSPRGTTDPDKVGVPEVFQEPPSQLVLPGQTTAAPPALSGPPHASPDIGRPGSTQFSPPGAEALGKGFLGPTLYDMLTQLVSPERPGVETPQIGPPSFVGPTPASGRTGLNDMGLPNEPGILDVIQQAPSLPSIDPGGLQDQPGRTDPAAPEVTEPPSVAPAPEAPVAPAPVAPAPVAPAPTIEAPGREAPLVSETPGILGVIAEALGLDSGEVRQLKDLSRATGIPIGTILAMAKKLADEAGVPMDMALQIVMQSQTQMDQVGYV